MGITPADLERMEYMDAKSEELYQRDLIVHDTLYGLKLIMEKDIFDYDENKSIYEVVKILNKLMK